jgi:hypothetical protein
MDDHSDNVPHVPHEILQWISAEYHGRYSRATAVTQGSISTVRA